jgi:transketolase
MTLSQEELNTLQKKALAVREHIIRLATDGGCFIGASLSCADLMVFLYNQVLRITPETTHDPLRDYMLLSKGHDVPALYGTLAELGFFEKERLANHLSAGDNIYWHPNRAIPGVEFHSGSLGHLLSVSIGIAMDIKIRGDDNRVFVMLGDGELNEGSIWEGCLNAKSHALDNLVAIIDRNGFQANMETEILQPLEPLNDKFAAFGWQVRRVNGHDWIQLEAAFHGLPARAGCPTVLIADTVRGKGVPSIERRAERWFVDLTKDEVEMLLEELHGQAQATLTSKPLIVR